LAHERSVCAVFDTDLYRQHLEAAYRTVCERQWQGQAPAACNVPSVR
jgi:hypothetical protein